MTRGYLDDAARKAFADAVTAIESASAVEVVIAIRSRARHWLHAPLFVGWLGSWVALAFMLFSAHPFALPSFLIDPVIVGALVGALSSQLPAVSRALTPRQVRRRAVQQIARATFYERGIHHTRGRTGVLVYIAIAEQMAEVVADDGVLRAIDPTHWQAAVEKVDHGVARGGLATATQLAQLAKLCGQALPRSHDDTNELPDGLDDGAQIATPPSITAVQA